MALFVLPPLEPDPAPPAPTAALAVVECPECADEPRSDCRTCYGAGVVEVCSGCGRVPWVVCGSEACSCTMPGLHADRCEYVGNDLTPCPNPAAIDGLCETCFRAGWEALEREDPAHPALSEEVVWALEVGWLTVEAAAA